MDHQKVEGKVTVPKKIGNVICGIQNTPHFRMNEILNDGVAPKSGGDTLIGRYEFN